jgi:hypothetical protein
MLCQNCFTRNFKHGISNLDSLKGLSDLMGWGTPVCPHFLWGWWFSDLDTYPTIQRTIQPTNQTSYVVSPLRSHT